MNPYYSKGFGVRVGSAYQPKTPTPGDLIRSRIVNENKKSDIIRKNIQMTKAGVMNDRNNRANKDEPPLQAWQASPRNRVITEYELLGALVKQDSGPEI